ncbi:MAG: hypothetical protein J0G94_04315 [Sphingomonadales bacterium]|nr:hypothetical protein [Sphingomonadales bacterium]
MGAGKELLEALRSFAEVERKIVLLGERPEVDNAHASAMVNARRELVMAFAKLGTALDTDPHLTAHPDKMTQGTRLFSAFRAQNAINQADWPAIRVRDDPAQYRVAAQSVVDRSRAFWQWVERELGFRR